MGRWMWLLLLLGLVVGCRDKQQAQGQIDAGLTTGQVAQPAPAGDEVSPEEITRLVRQLSSSKYSERVSAALQLGDSGAPEATTALLAALKAECFLSAEEVRARQLESPGLSPLVASGFLKGVYQMSLWKLGPQIREDVHAALAVADEPLRPWLIIVLGYLGDAEQLEPLMGLVQASPDGFIREAAARALGHLGRHEAAPVLREALKDPFVVEVCDVRVFLVREAARAALRQLDIEEQ